MTITEVSERITSTRIGSTGFAFLIDEEGKVIAHPSEKLTSTRQDLSSDPAVAAALTKGSKTLVYTSDTGRTIIAFSQRTRENWILVVQQDYAEAFNTVTKSNRDAIVLLTITLVIVFIIAVFFSRRLSVPVLRLTEVADALSRGKTDIAVAEVSRGDEIGLLANAIVRLGASMRLAIERLNRRAKKE